VNIANKVRVSKIRDNRDFIRNIGIHVLLVKEGEGLYIFPLPLKI
jgi:hypothetical protein